MFWGERPSTAEDVRWTMEATVEGETVAPGWRLRMMEAFEGSCSSRKTDFLGRTMWIRAAFTSLIEEMVLESSPSKALK